MRLNHPQPFLAPGTSFVENNFSMDWVAGMVQTFVSKILGLVSKTVIDCESLNVDFQDIMVE